MKCSYAAIERQELNMIKDINKSQSHLTLDERRIILTGISNGSTKSAIAQNIGKTNLLSVRKSNCIAPFLTNAVYRLNVQIIGNALTNEIVRLTVLNIHLFTVTDVTDLPGHVMVVLNGSIAVMINIHTIRKKHMLITKILWLNQESVLI